MINWHGYGPRILKGALLTMAVSLAFGVIFSTVISLVLVPAGYMILEDVKRILVRIRSV